MTGIEVSKNQLACTRLNAPLIPRRVDVGGGPQDKRTQREGMHACPPGQPLSGIQVVKNLNLCGDQYVVRVNSLKIGGVQEPGVPFLVSWNVICTDPACTVTLTDNGVPSFLDVLSRNSYVGSLSFEIEDGNSPIRTYTISATAGGGTDTRIVITQPRQ